MMANLMRRAPQMGEVGEFFILLRCISFRRGETDAAERTFEEALDTKVGDKLVHLKQVGPRIRGDVVYVPSDHTVFTGDVLFIEGHPIIWAGPVGNWIDACNCRRSTRRRRSTTDRSPTNAASRRTQLSDLHTRPYANDSTPAAIYDAAVDALADYDSWGMPNASS